MIWRSAMPSSSYLISDEFRLQEFVASSQRLLSLSLFFALSSSVPSTPPNSFFYSTATSPSATKSSSSSSFHLSFRLAAGAAPHPCPPLPSCSFSTSSFSISQTHHHLSLLLPTHFLLCHPLLQINYLEGY